MSGAISIKGNRYGLSVNIAEDADFEMIKAETASSFKSASKMFGKEKIAIGFEGRPLTVKERDELVEIIKENCSLDIVCIMDFNSETEERFRRAVQLYSIPDYISDILTEKQPDEELKKDKDTKTEINANNENGVSTTNMPEDVTKIALFYKGNLRSGMVINEESSLVIVGDINPGAEIYSGGNIIILGSLKGKAFAGLNGNSNAFVFALNMDPIQIRIADKIGRKSDSGKKKKISTDEHEPKIALVKDNSIAIELVSKTVLNDIIL